MERVIFFVEDEMAANSYVVDARTSGRFPGCRIIGRDFVEEALAWSGSPQPPTVFVIDSKMMPTPELKTELKGFLLTQGIGLEEIADGDIEVLTGALGSLLLRRNMPGCRIILLTAFARTIAEFREKNEKLDRLLHNNINAILPKRDPEALTKCIEEQLASLK